jgi:hypothetical protein
VGANDRTKSATSDAKTDRSPLFTDNVSGVGTVLKLTPK